MPVWKKYAIALPVFCLSISVVWFAICVIFGLDEHAGRGGAIGVMFSFAALFLLSSDRYHSIDVFDATYQDLFENFTEASQGGSGVLSEANSGRIDALKSDLKRTRMQARWENYSLSVSSLVSTFFGASAIGLRHC